MSTGTTTIQSLEEFMEDQHEQRLEQQRALALLPETALYLHQDVEQMGALLIQMGQMISVMQKRMDAMEARQATVTITHDQVKKLAALIRLRADEYSEKYSLTGPDCRKAIRAAIKKDVLTRAQVKDLHDLPAIALPAVESQVRNWTGIRLVFSLRDKYGGG